MTVFIFVRHGFGVNNETNILHNDPYDRSPLTNKGIGESEDVGKQLSKVKVSQIFSSPICRAYETAEIINRQFGFDIIRDMRLVERGAGKLNNTSNQNGRWRFNLTDKEFEEMLIEPWQKLQKRIVDFMDSVKNGGIVVAVTHEDVIKAIISYVLKLKEMQVLGLTVKNCSLTIVLREKRDCKLLYAGLPVLTGSIIKEINYYQNK